MRYRYFIGLLLAGMLWLPASVFAQDATPVAPPGVTIHVVQRDETLYRIAIDYDSTVDQLARLNSLSDPSSIYVGQRLLVPAPGSTPLPPQSVMHIVQPGETLESIGALYGVDVSVLLAQNQLADAASIYVGQLLDVTVSAAPILTPTPDTTPEPSPQAVTSISGDVAEVALLPDQPSTIVVHTVARGDTLFRIAKQYGVTVNELAQVNHIDDPTLIYPGQVLLIPGITPPQLALDMPASVTSLTVSPLIFVEGEAGRIHLQTSQATTVSGEFLNHTLHDGVSADGTDHTLYASVPLGTAMNVYPLDLTLTDSSGAMTQLPINIQVVSGGYGTETIQIVADRTNLIDPAMDQAELSHLAQITSNFTPTRYFDGLLGLPVAAPLSSVFGNLRSYNGGEFTRYHTGTDFAAAPGTPIQAAAAGTVVFAGPLDVRGNVTILDHGWGVFTVYCHQTEQYVNVGDVVTAGQVIGTTGSTGRVTGAHLHWELWINGVPVDAMQWVSDSLS